MSAGSRPPVYRPPPAHACDETTYPIDLGLGDGDRFYLRIRWYKGLIVDFAIEQVTTVGSKLVGVARIDCCGGTVHRHQFTPSGEDLLDHEPIGVIPAEDGYRVVNSLYEHCYELMLDQWEDNKRRWHDAH